MRYFLITVHQYQQEVSFLMCCFSANNLQSKFDTSTHNEFRKGVTDIGELGEWEYKELQHHITVTLDEADPNYKVSKAICHNIASCKTYNRGVWTQNKQSKMNLFT